MHSPRSAWWYYMADHYEWRRLVSNPHSCLGGWEGLVSDSAVTPHKHLTLGLNYSQFISCDWSIFSFIGHHLWRGGGGVYKCSHITDSRFIKESPPRYQVFRDFLTVPDLFRTFFHNFIYIYICVYVYIYIHTHYLQKYCKY